MSRPPGTITTVITAPPARGAPTDTGVLFLTGITQRGAVGSPIELHGMNDYATLLGNRVSTGLVYDTLDAAFREGLTKAVFSRVVGPAAAAATHSFNDRGGTPHPTVRADAASVGADGNSITVAIANGVDANTVVVTVKYNSAIVDISPELADVASIVAWRSNWVKFTDLASSNAAPSNLPAVITDTALSGGADDLGSVTETQWTNALAVFTANLGPGQVAAPGRTTDAAHQSLIAHAKANNRFAILDLTDTATVATLTAAAKNGALNLDGSYGAAFAPWVVVPGVVAGTTRTIPPSAVVAGLIAKSDAGNDAATNASQLINPMGPLGGASSYALDVTQTWVDDDRGTLNDGDVNVLRNPYGTVMVYGLRSLDGSGDWTQFYQSRTRMKIIAQANAIGDNYEGQEIDDAWNGMFAGDLKAMLGRMKDRGELFAFAVDNGPNVQTPTLSQQGIRAAVLSVQMNSASEFTNIQVIKYPLTATIPTAA